MISIITEFGPKNHKMLEFGSDYFFGVRYANVLHSVFGTFDVVFPRISINDQGGISFKKMN